MNILDIDRLESILFPSKPPDSMSTQEPIHLFVDNIQFPWPTTIYNSKHYMTLFSHDSPMGTMPIIFVPNRCYKIEWEDSIDGMIHVVFARHTGMYHRPNTNTTAWEFSL